MKQIASADNLRRLLLALAPRAVLGAVVAVLWTWLAVPRTYSAQAQLAFLMSSRSSPLDAMIAAGAGRVAVPVDSDYPLGTYEALLTAEPVLLAVAERFNVRNLFALQHDDQVLTAMREFVKARVDRVEQAMSVRVELPGTPRVCSPWDLASGARAAERDAARRKMTKELLDALLDQARRHADDLKLDRYKVNLDQLQQRFATEEAKLKELTRAMARVQEATGNVDIGAYAKGLTQALVETRSRAGQAEAQLAHSRARLAAAREAVARQGKRVGDLPAEAPFLQRRRAQYAEARDRYQDANQRFGPQNPAVARAAADLRQAEANLQRELSAARGGLAPDVLSAEGELAALEASRRAATQALTDARQELAKLPADVNRIALLQSEVQAQMELVGQVRTQMFAAQSLYDQRGIKWSVLSPPRVPRLKSGPSTIKAALAGLFLGIFLLGLPLWRGLGQAALRDYAAAVAASRGAAG